MRIAHRDAANPWMRSAVLCSCAAVAERMLVEFWNDAEAAAVEAPVRRCDRAVARAARRWSSVRAIERPEIDARSLITLAMKVNGSPKYTQLRDRVILALARGCRRSGGRLPAGSPRRSPGARLVSDVIDESQDCCSTTTTRRRCALAAIARLVVLDPAEAPAVLVQLLEPREPVAVQARSCAGPGRSEAAEAAKILLPRLRGFEPSVRARRDSRRY